MASHSHGGMPSASPLPGADVAVLHPEEPFVAVDGRFAVIGSCIAMVLLMLVWCLRIYLERQHVQQRQKLRALYDIVAERRQECSSRSANSAAAPQQPPDIIAVDSV